MTFGQYHKATSPEQRDFIRFLLSHTTCVLTLSTLDQLYYSHIVLFVQVAELAWLAELLPPRSPTVCNPVADSSLCRLQSCSPIAFASAAARRLRPLQLLLPGPIAASTSTAIPPLPPLLLPDCVCCSPLASASAAAPNRVHFGCYSPIVSASTAAP